MSLMYIHSRKDFLLSMAVLGVMLTGMASPARAGLFLDITSLTPGTSGSFAGTLDGVGVTGAITTTNSFFQLDVPGATYFESTINDTSPQYSYGNIYTPSIPATDRIGYTSFQGTVNPATITINFSSAVTNLVFHVANLDAMQYNFAPTVGLTGLALLSGNGGSGDGLQVVGTVISDIDPTTVIPQNTTDSPFTAGARSAYGSVLLIGTFNSLTIDVTNPLGAGDGGSFTISAVPVPEPSTLSLAGLGSILALGAWRHRRQRAA